MQRSTNIYRWGYETKNFGGDCFRNPSHNNHERRRGFRFEPGKDILVADDAQEFAEAVIRVLTNPETQKFCSNALQKVQEKYDWSKILPNFWS